MEEKYKSLGIRLLLLTISAYLFATRSGILGSFMLFPVVSSPPFNVRMYQLLWLFLVAYLVKEMLPRFSSRIDNGKMFSKYYKGPAKLTPAAKRSLRECVKKTNAGAAKSFVFWLLILSAVGAGFQAARIAGMFGVNAIITGMLLLIFLDEIWISVWCPFRNWLIKNKCCNTCRINDWGFAMLLSPLVFVPSFWTYSLVLLALAVAVEWELMHRMHPERFYEVCNQNLRCKNCRRICENCARKKIR